MTSRQPSLSTARGSGGRGARMRPRPAGGGGEACGEGEGPLQLVTCAPRSVAPCAVGPPSPRGAWRTRGAGGEPGEQHDRRGDDQEPGHRCFPRICCAYVSPERSLGPAGRGRAEKAVGRRRNQLVAGASTRGPARTGAIGSHHVTRRASARRPTIADSADRRPSNPPLGRWRLPGMYGVYNPLIYAFL